MAHDASAAPPELARTLLRDTRGAVLVEYIILIGTVALTCIPVFAYCGATLARDFGPLRNYMFYPFP
jgi:Flp pilus assembly pilin Flp